MGKTNSLTSHHPERNSYSAEKGVPKAVLKRARTNAFSGRNKGKSKVGKVLKKMHKKKARQFSKTKIRKEINNL